MTSGDSSYGLEAVDLLLEKMGQESKILYKKVSAKLQKDLKMLEAEGLKLDRRETKMKEASKKCETDLAFFEKKILKLQEQENALREAMRVGEEEALKREAEVAKEIDELEAQYQQRLAETERVELELADKIAALDQQEADEVAHYEARRAHLEELREDLAKTFREIGEEGTNFVAEVKDHVQLFKEVVSELEALQTSLDS